MEPAQYNEILERLRVRIRNFAASQVKGDVAEDIAQDTMITLTTKYSGVTDEAELVPLSMEIVRYKLLETYRKQKWNVSLTDEEGEEKQIPAPGLTAEDHVLLGQLKAAIPKLSQQCRDMFRWKLLEWSYEDMARQTGKTKNHLYVICNRCKEELQAMLGVAKTGRKGAKS